mgnify:FL=1
MNRIRRHVACNLTRRSLVPERLRRGAEEAVDVGRAWPTNTSRWRTEVLAFPSVGWADVHNSDASTGLLSIRGSEFATTSSEPTLTSRGGPQRDFRVCKVLIRSCSFRSGFALGR